MEVRSLAFRTDLAIRRAAGSEVAHADDHVVVRTPANPGFYWGNAVVVGPVAPTGRFAPGRLAGTFAGMFPGASHVAVGVDGTDGMPTDVAAAFERAGLDVAVDTVLTARELSGDTLRDLDAGTVVRPLEGEDDWVRHRALRLVLAREDGKGGGTSTPYLDAREDERRRLHDGGRATWWGAFVDGEIRATLGVVATGAGDARYQSVATQAGYRRRGLAGHLVLAAGRASLGRPDVDRLVIVAEADGPAIGLYRRVGFGDVELQVQLSRTG